MASSTKDSSQYQLQTDARIKLILHNDTLFTPQIKYHYGDVLPIYRLLGLVRMPFIWFVRFEGRLNKNAVW